MVCFGMVWNGMIRYGVVSYGMVWYVMVRHGMLWYGTAAVCHSVGGVSSPNAGGIARRLHPPAHPEVLGGARRDPPDLPPDHGDQVRVRARLFFICSAMCQWRKRGLLSLCRVLRGELAR